MVSTAVGAGFDFDLQANPKCNRTLAGVFAGIAQDVAIYLFHETPISPLCDCRGGAGRGDLRRLAGTPENGGERFPQAGLQFRHQSRNRFKELANDGSTSRAGRSAGAVSNWRSW